MARTVNVDGCRKGDLRQMTIAIPQPLFRRVLRMSKKDATSMSQVVTALCRDGIKHRRKAAAPVA